MAGKLFNNFKSSDIIQGVLAIMLGASICYCVIVSLVVPIEIFGAFMLILGYYFRTNNHKDGGEGWQTSIE